MNDHNNPNILSLEEAKKALALDIDTLEIVPGPQEAAARLIETVLERAQTDPGAPFEAESLEALALLEETDEAAFIRAWAKLQHCSGVPLRSLRKALDRFKKTPQPHDGDYGQEAAAQRPLWNPKREYPVKNNAFYRRKFDREGEPIESPLCNFFAMISKEISRDNGIEVNRVLVIEGQLQGGCSLPAVEVPLSKFIGMHWVLEAWGSAAMIQAGTYAKDALRLAIQAYSEQVEMETIYAHTGWRKVSGAWRYLHTGGAIGADGNLASVSVELDSRLQDYTFDNAPPADARQMLRLFTELTRDGALGYLLLACAFRAPLCALQYADFSLFLAGRTGSQKSSVTGVALAFFGRHWGSGRSFPADWKDTYTDLEIKSSQAKDALFAVDDFKPKGAASINS
jgi:hypothetical protein